MATNGDVIINIRERLKLLTQRVMNASQWFARCVLGRVLPF